MYDHFHQSSTCPTCRQVLGASDFMELCIAEAPVNPPEEFKTMFQKVFTKGTHSTGSPYLQYMDACQKALAAQDAARRVTQFVFKQFCLETNKSGESSGRLKQSFERLKQDYTQLQQSSSAQRLEAEQAVATAQNRANSLQQQLSAQHQKNSELLEQVEFFRQQLAKEGFLQPPSSPGSLGRGSVNSKGSAGHHGQSHGNGGGHYHLGQSRSQNPHQGHRTSSFSSQGLGQPPPPLREVHANRQNLLAPPPPNINIHRAPPGPPDPTPIRIAPSFDSTSRSTTTTGTGAPPIRDLRGGYTFTSSRHHSSLSAGSNGSGGGPVRRMQQSFASSRPTNYGRPGGMLGGRRR